PLEFEVPNLTSARALVRELRLDSEHLTSRAVAGRGSLPRSLLAIAPLVACLVLFRRGLDVSPDLRGFLALGLACLLVYFAFLRILHVTVHVGTDGVRLERWPLSATFIAFTDVDHVAVEGHELRARLRSGERFRLHEPWGTA